MRAAIPLLLTALRVLLAPMLIILALFQPNRTAFGVCLVIAFFSDVFDGIIARHLKVATSTLRRFDSLADSIFYVAALIAGWHLYPSVFRIYRGALVILGTLELARYAFDFTKFNKEASYHMSVVQNLGGSVVQRLFLAVGARQGRTAGRGRDLCGYRGRRGRTCNIDGVTTVD